MTDQEAETAAAAAASPCSGRAQRRSSGASPTRASPAPTRIWRASEAYPELDAAALPDVRGRDRGGEVGRGALRHDPDRELGGGARGRHPPPAARGRGCTSSASISCAMRYPAMALKGASSRRSVKTCTATSQALGQCRKHHPQARPEGACGGRHGGRGAAGRGVEGDRPRGALAPRLAAEIYGLNILAEDIEDEQHNTTRFVMLSRRGRRRASRQRRPMVTTFIFNVRNVPAALYKAMGGFATNGINMTKLESPIRSTASSWRPCSTPTSRAIRPSGCVRWRWRSCRSSRPRCAFWARIARARTGPRSHARHGRALLPAKGDLA